MILKLDRTNFRGPWCGPPVSWNSRMLFDEATYRADIQRCCAIGIPGVYTAGTTGEFYAMEFDEFQAIARATVEVGHRHKVPVAIGCTSTYTMGAARRAAFAAEIGADAIQVALPFWMEVGDEQVVPFFKEVAAAAPGLALSVYETKRTKKVLTAVQHRQIHAAVPQYVMLKANAGTLGYSPEGCKELSDIVNVFVSETKFASLGRLGAAGGCSAMVFWFPRYIAELWRRVEAKDWAEADRRCTVLAEMLTFIVAEFEGRGFTDTALDRMGGRLCPYLATGLQGRGPYPSPTEADVAILRRWCEKREPALLEMPV